MVIAVDFTFSGTPYPLWCSRYSRFNSFGAVQDGSLLNVYWWSENPQDWTRERFVSHLHLLSKYFPCIPFVNQWGTIFPNCLHHNSLFNRGCIYRMWVALLDIIWDQYFLVFRTSQLVEKEVSSTFKFERNSTTIRSLPLWPNWNITPTKSSLHAPGL